MTLQPTRFPFSLEFCEGCYYICILEFQRLSCIDMIGRFFFNIGNGFIYIIFIPLKLCVCILKVKHTRKTVSHKSKRMENGFDHGSVCV